MAAKQYIKSFHERDRQALCALARTGILYREDFYAMEIKKSRLYRYDKEKQGLTERKFASNGKEYYTLTAKGKKFVHDRWGVKAYTHRPGMYNHDKALRDKYMSLTPAQRETVKTETEVQNEIRDIIQDWKNSGKDELINQAYELEDKWSRGLCSAPDMTYEATPGITTFYEVITKNYTEAEISAKFEMASSCSCTLEWVRV